MNLRLNGNAIGFVVVVILLNFQQDNFNIIKIKDNIITIASIEILQRNILDCVTGCVDYHNHLRNG